MHSTARPKSTRLRSAALAIMFLLPLLAAQPTFAQDDSVRSLFRAAATGDLAGVQASLAAGADINAVNRAGLTATDVAVDKGHFKVAHFLLSVRNTATAGRDSLTVAPPQPPAAALAPSTTPTAPVPVPATPKATARSAPPPPALTGPSPFDPSQPVATGLPSLPVIAPPPARSIKPVPPTAATAPPAPVTAPVPQQTQQETPAPPVAELTPAAPSVPEQAKLTTLPPAPSAPGPVDRFFSRMGSVFSSDDSATQPVIQEPASVAVVESPSKSEPQPDPIAAADVEPAPETDTSVAESKLSTLPPAPRPSALDRFFGRVGSVFSSDAPAPAPVSAATPPRAPEAKAPPKPKPAPAPVAAPEPVAEPEPAAIASMPQQTAPVSTPAAPAPKSKQSEKPSSDFLSRLAKTLQGPSKTETTPAPTTATPAPAPETLAQAAPKPAPATPAKKLSDLPPAPSPPNALDKFFGRMTTFFSSGDPAHLAPDPSEDPQQAPPGTESETGKPTAQQSPMKAAPPQQRVIKRELIIGGEGRLGRQAPPTEFGVRLPCVEKRRKTVVVCVEDVNWPQDVRPLFAVESVLYRGFKMITRYNRSRASFIHVLFPVSSFKEVVAYFTRRYGEPTETWTRTIAPLGEPRRPNPVMVWFGFDPAIQKPVFLEVRQYDDARADFPDTRNGAVLLHYEDATPIFPLVSKIELMRIR